MHTGLTSDKKFFVFVTDCNDAIPVFTLDKFIGLIDENVGPDEFLERQKYTTFSKHSFRNNGEPIVTVKATDADSPGPQSELRFRIIDDSHFPASQYFRIDELTGGIFPLREFDHEKTESYIFDVEASDSMATCLPGSNQPNKGLQQMSIDDLRIFRFGQSPDSNQRSGTFTVHLSL